MLTDLLIGGFQAEELGAKVPALCLAGGDLTLQIVTLGLPLSKDLKGV